MNTNGLFDNIQKAYRDAEQEVEKESDWISLPPPVTDQKTIRQISSIPAKERALRQSIRKFSMVVWNSIRKAFRWIKIVFVISLVFFFFYLYNIYQQIKPLLDAYNVTIQPELPMAFNSSQIEAKVKEALQSKTIPLKETNVALQQETAAVDEIIQSNLPPMTNVTNLPEKDVVKLIVIKSLLELNSKVVTTPKR